MPRQKKCRHRADGEECLLTFPFIGLFRFRDLPGTTLENQCGPGRSALLRFQKHVSNYIGLFVGCVFILVSVMPVPIMRGRSGVPYKNQKLTRIVTAVLGFMILLLWYSAR